MNTSNKTRTTIKREILTILHQNMFHDTLYSELENYIEKSGNFDLEMSRMDGTFLKIYKRNDVPVVCLTLAGLVEFNRIKGH